MTIRGLMTAAPLLVSALLATSCSQTTKQKATDSSGETPATGDQTTADPTATGTDTAADASATADSWDQGYYTGFDGTNKFSLYLPSFRPMTVADPTIAKLESLSVTLSAKTIDELVAARKAKDASFDDTRLRQMLTKARTVQKLTPLKPGKTTLKTAADGRGPGGNSWKSGQSVVLVVSSYTPDQVAKGKNRYTRDGDDNKRPCASCHETGESGAPPHELGDIMSIPDKSAEQWVTTGKLADRTAKIPHTWEFDSSDEELGTVAYLRTLQTDDLETLTKLEFENQAKDLPPPPTTAGN